MIFGRWRRFGLSAALCSLAVVGCGITGCSHSASDERAVLSVSPSTALFDAPVTTVLRGPASTLVTVRASAVSADGTDWTSAAEFRSDAAGTVSLGQPALQGSYTGTDAMGLFGLLEPPPTSADADFTPPAAGFDVVLRASIGGRQVASATAHRQSPATLGVTHQDLRMPTDGLYGELCRPVHQTGNRPALVVFGGSEGGLGPWVIRQASLLAARGYPTLALAYFDEPGLPATLLKVPLEYFAKALTVLRAQPALIRNTCSSWAPPAAAKRPCSWDRSSRHWSTA